MATKTELYRFSEQATGLVWRYTSGNEVVMYDDDGTGAKAYTPVSIARSEAEIKTELARANIEIELPLTNELSIRWLRDNGEKIVSVTIFQRERGGTFNVVWKGRLVSLIPNMTQMVLKMESIFTSLRRPGLRARYQRGCRHALYGRGCTLNPEAFASVGNITSVTGETFTIAEAATHPNGYFVGGMLRAPDGNLSYIVNHVGTLITIQRLSYSLVSAIAAGLPVAIKLYPGCEHNRTACSSKFNNILNYGGFDFIPVKNPMGGSSIV